MRIDGGDGSIAGHPGKGNYSNKHMSDPTLNWKTLLGRGLHRNCPQCGEGKLFVRWVKLADRCPVCGLKYLENQGDLWGLLLLADRVLFMIPFIAIFLVPHDPGALWPYLFGGAMALGLVYSFPHRMGISVAIDYRIRRSSSDLANKQTGN